MDRQELARAIFKTSYLRGDFLLRSGQRSTEYFDKYRFEADPRLLKAIAQSLKPLIPAGTEALAGLELGGVPLATALALETGLPVAFVRKEAKSYGTCQVAEGLELRGKKVVIIEDVVTTGGQVLLSTEDLRKLGAQVSHVLCVIHRGANSGANNSGANSGAPQGAATNSGAPKGAANNPLAKANLELRALFTMEELKSSN